MKIKIGDKTYQRVDVDQLTLLNVIKLQTETAELGHPLTMAALRDMSDEIEKLPIGKQDEHPDVLWLIGTSIWASRLAAGEQVTFAEALSFPMSQMEFIPEPGDEQPDPTKARPIRKVSGRAVKRAPAKKTRTLKPLS